MQLPTSIRRGAGLRPPVPGRGWPRSHGLELGAEEGVGWGRPVIHYEGSRDVH